LPPRVLVIGNGEATKVPVAGTAGDACSAEDESALATPWLSGIRWTADEDPGETGAHWPADGTPEVDVGLPPAADAVASGGRELAPDPVLTDPEGDLPRRFSSDSVPDKNAPLTPSYTPEKLLAVELVGLAPS
jgi:hypothetical protein